MNHIAALPTGQRLHRQPPVGKHLGHQISADQRLGHHLRRQKQALKQQPVEIKAGAAFGANAWSREAAASLLHQISAARHIAARGSNGAAEIFDQGAGNQISAHLRGLGRFHQLAVAVIDKHQGGWAVLTHLLHEPADLGHRQRWPPAVAAAALNQHHPRDRAEGISQGRLINAAIGGELEFVVMDAELSQGALAAAAQTDHLLEGVVGAAGDRQQPIAWTQHAKQGSGDGVGAADELQPHRRCFSAKHPGKDAIERVAAQIVVAVTADGGEVVGAHPLGLKGRQHLGQLGLHRSGASCRSGAELLLGGGNGLPSLGRSSGPGGQQSQGATEGQPASATVFFNGS